MTFGDWLLAARKRQVNPKTKRATGWSQAHVAKLVTAETGHTLYREALSAYEHGGGMEPDTYDRLVAFWDKHGERGAPAYDAQPETPLSYETQHLELLRQQVEQAKRQADALQMIAGYLLSAREAGPAKPDVEAVFEQFLARIVSQPPTASPLG